MIIYTATAATSDIIEGSAYITEEVLEWGNF